MKRWIPAVVALLLVAAAMAHTVPSVSKAATPNPVEATVAALSAQVSSLETQVAALAGATASPPSTSTPVYARSEPTASSAYAIAYGDWTISPTNVDKVTRLGQGGPTETKAKGFYFILYFSLINNGNQPQSFDYDGLQAMDSKGRTFDLDHSATFNLTYGSEGLAPSDNLQPGLIYHVGGAFDIPTDAQIIEVVSKDGAIHVLIK